MSLTPEHILEHGPFLRGLARSLLRDAASADDVVQEAWMAALRRPQEVRDLRPWLVGVVRNLVRHDQRASARRQAREQQAGAPTAERDPADVVESEEARRRLVDALLALEEPYRTPLLLRYYDELPPREIARRLGVPGSTVRTRIQRGLEQLRAGLDAHHGGDRRAWCLAILPLALGPRGGVPLAGSVFTGAVSMKIQVSVIVLAICACVFLLLQFGQADTPTRGRPVARESMTAPEVPPGSFAAPQGNSERQRGSAATAQPVLDPNDPTLPEGLSVSGTARMETGEPPIGITIAAFPMNDAAPEPEATAIAKSRADGSFELRVPGQGPHLVVAAAIGYRPHSAIVDVALDEPAVLEPFSLVVGASVAGRVTQVHGGGVAGARVRAKLQRDGVNLDTKGTPFQLCYANGRVFYRSVSVDSGEQGRYRMGGLMPTEYEVALLEIPGAHHGLTAGIGSRERGYEFDVVVPRDGVDFEVAFATLEIVVRSGTRRLENAKLILTQHKRTEAGSSRYSNFIPIPADGRLRRGVSPEIELTVAVEADGMLPQKRDLRAPVTGATRQLVFDMEPAHFGSLRVTCVPLADPAPPAPPSIEFSLQPLPHGETVERHSTLEDGVHVVSRIEPGRYRVTAYAGSPGYLFPVSAEVTVAPDAAVPLTMRPRVGGRLHILYTARDGRTDRSGFVKVVAPNGRALDDLRITKRHGSESTMCTDRMPDTKGPGEIDRVLEPGMYRVILEPDDEDAGNLEQEVRIVAGRTVVAELRE